MQTTISKIFKGFGNIYHLINLNYYITAILYHNLITTHLYGCFVWRYTLKFIPLRKGPYAVSLDVISDFQTLFSILDCPEIHENHLDLQNSKWFFNSFLKSLYKPKLLKVQST